MDSYTSKVYEEIFRHERFVSRHREDIPTSTTRNSNGANLAQGPHDLSCEKWSPHQSHLCEYGATYATIIRNPAIGNPVKVIPMTYGNDLNDNGNSVVKVIPVTYGNDSNDNGNSVVKVIPVTYGNDSNDNDSASEINTLDSINTSMDSKPSDDIESSNHINNENDNDWDFINEELGELGLEGKNPKMSTFFKG